MTGDEDQPQQIVADVIVQGRVEVRRGQLLLDLEFVAKLLVLALQQRAASQLIDGAMLGGCHQPRARIVRYARLGPLRERGDERVLREILGEPDVTHDARQAGDDFRRFNPPDRVDRAMGVRGRHGLGSHHCLICERNWLGGVKSSGSITCRSSIVSFSEPGQRDAHSIASSFDFTWIIQ